MRKDTKNIINSPAKKTEGGMEIRSATRVGSIRCKHSEDVPASFWTWQCCNMIRRNFYWLSAEVFFGMKKKENRGELRVNARDHTWTPAVHAIPPPSTINSLKFQMFTIT